MRHHLNWLSVLFVSLLIGLFENMCYVFLCMHACMLSHFSCAQLLVTLQTVARQAPLSLGILQARILERVVMPSSRGSSWPSFLCILEIKAWGNVSCLHIMCGVHNSVKFSQSLSMNGALQGKTCFISLWFLLSLTLSLAQDWAQCMYVKGLSETNKKFNSW